jgi:hypothetical protein
VEASWSFGHHQLAPEISERCFSGVHGGEGVGGEGRRVGGVHDLLGEILMPSVARGTWAQSRRRVGRGSPSLVGRSWEELGEGGLGFLERATP